MQGVKIKKGAPTRPHVAVMYLVIHTTSFLEIDV